MPNTLEEHINYTRSEWSKIEYYVNILEYLKSKNIKSFIDLGGCVGEVSMILDENIKLDTIYIIEPVIENYNFIVNRFINNENIKVINKAVYYGTDKIELGQMSNDKNVGGWSFSDNHSIDKVNVDTIKLEEFPICDFIKVDIEGSEHNLITNSENLKKFKFISLELHSDLINNYKDLISNYLPNHNILFIYSEQLFLEMKE
jgi:FkbM family methyltransferase